MTKIAVKSLIIVRFSIQNHCWKAQHLCHLTRSALASAPCATIRDNTSHMLDHWSSPQRKNLSQLVLKDSQFWIVPRKSVWGRGGAMVEIVHTILPCVLQDIVYVAPEAIVIAIYWLLDTVLLICAIICVWSYWQVSIIIAEYTKFI